MDPTSVAVPAAAGAAGAATTAFIAKFFFERWVNKRESSEKELRDQIDSLEAAALVAADVHRAEIERTRSGFYEEIRILRDRSHALANEVGIAVTRTAVNTEMIAQLRDEMRGLISTVAGSTKEVKDEVGSLRTTIVKLSTIVQERLPNKKETGE